jgi:sensor histidine kinase YesM
MAIGERLPLLFAGMAQYSLNEPLPAGVFDGVSGPWVGYRAFPTYSRQWFWRRTALFAPFAGGVGLLQSLLIGVQVRSAPLGWLCAAVGVPVWIVIVTAGPAFATLVRHRNLPMQRERLAVVIAIVAGLAVSCFAQYLANEFSRAYILPRYRLYFSVVGGPQHVNVAIIWLIRSVFGAMFFCLGGGLALRTYFKEQSTWIGAQHARELESLRQEKNEADLRLTVLQAQVEPHFLFNTLASIHSLIRPDPTRAEATIEALVDHLRATMPKFRAEIGSTHSTLAQQIEVCSSYLAVMQVRMGHRLRYTVDVPEYLHSHTFPPLMLISLVENAIKHGIEPSPSGGNIVMSAAVEVHGEGQQLAVSVTDDGVGLRTGIGGGLGLNNIREQLAARFRQQGALVIRGRTVGGVIATIRVPYTEPQA